MARGPCASPRGSRCQLWYNFALAQSEYAFHVIGALADTRTLDEIATWGSMSGPQRAEVWALIEARRAQPRAV